MFTIPRRRKTLFQGSLARRPHEHLTICDSWKHYPYCISEGMCSPGRYWSESLAGNAMRRQNQEYVHDYTGDSYVT